MNTLLELYLTFFKMGLFTFGGGYAMLPLLEREVVEKKKWASHEEILDYYAIGQPWLCYSFYNNNYNNS